jgi:hypothetical protein
MITVDEELFLKHRRKLHINIFLGEWFVWSKLIFALIALKLGRAV